MLEHLLIDDEIVPNVANVNPKASPTLEGIDPSDLLDAQVKATDIISMLEDEEDDIVGDLQRNAANVAFLEMTNGTSLEETRTKLLKLKVPKAVRHLVGMLTAYEWEFVDQAKELRGYAVAKILEETHNPDARIRLKALEMLGKVTEVALFTERVEIKAAALTDDELDAKLREKLMRFTKAADAVAKTTQTDDALLIEDASDATPSTAPDES